jgi:putative nucleotide binding protein
MDLDLILSTRDWEPAAEAAPESVQAKGRCSLLGLEPQREFKVFEEYGRVLDYLPQGTSRRSYRNLSTPLIQVLGEAMFTLLEATIHRRANIEINQRVYIGKGRRDIVDHILGRIRYEDLSAEARDVLPDTVEAMAKNQEQKFVQFMNEAQPVSPRMHSIELFAGIGKTYTMKILVEREKAPFKGFGDISSRVGLQDPTKIFAKRILDELTTEQKYHLFTRPY